jgi:DNA-binding NtrC family response regulator
VRPLDTLRERDRARGRVAAPPPGLDLEPLPCGPDLAKKKNVKPPPTVAVLNSNEDVVELLRTALEGAGFVVVSAHSDQIRRGAHSLSEFVGEHNPNVLIYDAVPPYDRSMRFLQHLQSTESMRGRHVIVTSANAAAARELGGVSMHVYQILGKPYDIDEIVEAVRRAANEPTERNTEGGDPQ